MPAPRGVVLHLDGGFSSILCSQGVTAGRHALSTGNFRWTLGAVKLANRMPALHQLLYLLPRGSELVLVVRLRARFHLAAIRMLEREEVLRAIFRRLIHVFGAQREPGGALRAEGVTAFVHDLLLHGMSLWPICSLTCEAASSTLELLSDTVLPGIERVHDCVQATVELLDALQIVRLVEVLCISFEERLQDVRDLSVGA